jgi:adenosylmethionine---8-amino-7-oxononanoate aminotransferase
MEQPTLLEKDLAYIWHPFTQAEIEPPPIPLVKSEGIWLYGADGKKYIDAISSWWVNLHGHSHPYIAKKIKEQLDQLNQVIFAGFTHLPAVHLAERLLALLPGNMRRIFYSDNGSTATETAIKMAIQFWFNENPKTQKRKVIGFKGSYHGDTFGAMSAAGKQPFTRPFWNHLFDADFIDPPLPGKEEIALSQISALLSKDEHACFIFEPHILGAGGMIIYSMAGLDRLLQECREHQVLTIADEVMTGFGRTGPLFACENLTEKPDFICLSKGITGGFLPLGATACKEAIYNQFRGNSLQKAFLHGHSYTAGPLSCQSALASLDLLLTSSCSEQRKTISSMHEEFCCRWRGHPKLKRCESLGTILVVEYRADEDSYFSDLGRALRKRFLDKGIFIRPLGNVLYLMPPYVIDPESLQTIYEEISYDLL